VPCIARCRARSSAILLDAMYRLDSWLAIPANGPVALTRRPPAKRRLLTPREREVLAWVARGKSAWEIGEILDIAKRTVDEHVQSAVRKLGAVNRTHAVALAIRDHLVEI
jgi:LuxR family transcriptional regulator, quorum-sensing system regulator BjaR1